MNAFEKLRKDAEKKLKPVTEVVKPVVQPVQQLASNPSQASKNPQTLVNPLAPGGALGAMGPLIFGGGGLPSGNPFDFLKGGFGGAWDSLTGQLGETRKDVYGEYPQIKPEQVLPGLPDIKNTYGTSAQQLGQQPLKPDFTDAIATGGLQTNLAKALSGLYGTGAGAVTGLMEDLERQRQGDFGPGGSLAQAMLQQGLSQNIANVRSQLASQRGLSPALAARYAAQQAAQLGGQTAQQAGILGLQQQLAAQQQLGQLGMGSAELGGGVGGQLLSKARESDITQAMAKSDADLKKLNILAQSDVELQKLAQKSGIDAATILLEIEKANQAAASGDRDAMFKIMGGILSGIAGAAAKGSMQGAAYGGRIEGQALVDGDHPKNDIVPAMLSPGEIVIPRTAAQDKKKAKAFLDALDGWDEKPSYTKVLKARRARA